MEMNINIKCIKKQFQLTRNLLHAHQLEMSSTLPPLPPLVPLAFAAVSPVWQSCLPLKLWCCSTGWGEMCSALQEFVAVKCCITLRNLKIKRSMLFCPLLPSASLLSHQKLCLS